MSPVASCVTGEELAFLDLVAERAPTPLRAIDAGANVGDYTLALMQRRPDARVMCFEPQREAYNVLRARVPRAYLYDCGLSDRRRTVDLNTTPAGHGPCVQATVVGRPDLNGYHGTALALSRAEEVQLERLDDTRWREVIGERVHLLKIDVEGHEAAAMTGAEELLRTTDIVQFEFNDCAIHAGVAFQDIEYLLARFRIHALTPDGIERDWHGHIDVEADRLVWRGPVNFIAIAGDCEWWRP